MRALSEDSDWARGFGENMRNHAKPTPEDARSVSTAELRWPFSAWAGSSEFDLSSLIVNKSSTQPPAASAFLQGMAVKMFLFRSGYKHVFLFPVFPKLAGPEPAQHPAFLGLKQVFWRTSI